MFDGRDLLDLMKRPLRALVLLGLLGCNEDRSLIMQFVEPTVSGVTVVTTGGNATAAGPGSATGGDGGSIVLQADTTLSIGTATIFPEPLGLPVLPPAAGTVISSTSNFVANTVYDVPLGNILIEGTVATDVPAGGTRTIQADNGDIVVSGTLQSGQVTALSPSGQVIKVLANLALNAPQGTVWVTGSIHTGSVDGIQDGVSSGTLTIVANRIVLSGTLDASGEANATGVVGGNGGAITLTILPNGNGIFCPSGLITTQGGNGTGQGGSGGAVSLNSASGTAPVNLFGSITTSGGSASGSFPNALGGTAGDISIGAGGPVVLKSALLGSGGDAATSADGAVGGNGANVTLTGGGGGSSVPLEMFGTLDLHGGAASAATSASPVHGGHGGTVAVGPGVLSLLTGVSSYDSSGGAGDTGGNAGAQVIISTGGGAADLTVVSTLQALGGAGQSGPGGAGNDISIVSTSVGLLTVSGSIALSGGASLVADGGAGGNYSLVSIVVGPGAGDILSSAGVAASGGNGGSSGLGGAAGTITVQSQIGMLTLSGRLEADGGGSPVGLSGPASGGTVTIATTGPVGPGAIQSTATIIAVGGSSQASTTANGGPGGTISISAADPGSTLTLAAGSFLQVDGGSSSGAGDGGAGGTIFLGTTTQSISISGSVLARGGTALGSNGTGGSGGQITAELSVGNPLSSITVQANGGLDASGGAGFFEGRAQSDGRIRSVSAPVAVVLKAEPAAGTAGSGSVVNLGTITAAGAAGGDVLFLGFGAAGLGLPLPGEMNLSGSSGNPAGDFVGRN